MNNKLILPASIILAGALIAGAVFLTKNNTPGTNLENETALTNVKEIDLAPITDSDHVAGNPDAKIAIVEYSDTECPFCKTYQVTMGKIMDKFGNDGSVRWVYRHFPIEQLHSKANNEAQATECVNELGGSEKFWQYLDKIYKTTKSNDTLDPAKLPELAKAVGVDEAKFKACLSSGKYKQKVDDQYQSGLKAGVNSTPNSILVLKTALNDDSFKFLNSINDELKKQMGQDGIIINPDKTKVLLAGAFPYELMEQVLNKLLGK